MTLPGPRLSIWNEIAAHESRLAQLHTRELFEQDSGRTATFSREALGLWFDFSRQRLDREAFYKLYALLDFVQLRDRIDAMWAGDHINGAEDRAVLHVALRQPKGAGIGGAATEALVLAERERMLAFADRVRGAEIRGSSGKPFDLVVNVGIGGSDLGPAMGVLALAPYTAGAPKVAFVSNVDGNHLHDVLAGADPATTLFIVASKTFTTLETQTNAQRARQWLSQRLGEQAVPMHFAAVSTNTAAMNAFGVHPQYRFDMWDWVGGRYSMWSSVGVSLAIAIGSKQFQEFLAGGHEMDVHFQQTAWADNLPALMALIGVWNINFRHLPTLAVLPYDDRLQRFSAYLQQLEMESNGKSVTTEGERVQWETAPVIWGEPGNNAQHSFFQLLHQGTMRAAMDFLAPVNSSCANQHQQDLALANCLAQAEAFLEGQAGADIPPQKVHVGDRPCNLLLFERLDPRTLGKLVALYEHKVFTQGVIWGINSFDQWGVELGKKLAVGLAPAVKDPASALNVSPRVRAALQRVTQWRGK